MLSFAVTNQGGAGGHVITSLTSALGAQSEPADSLPDLSSTPSVGWLVAAPTEYASRDTQAGGDPSEVALLLSHILEPGNWVAISLRPPTRNEMRVTRRWFHHRLDGAVTHYSNDGESLVASIYAGASSPDDVSNLLHQLSSAIPGFDIDTVIRTNRTPPVDLILYGLGLGAWLAGGIETHHWLLSSLAGSVVALAGFVAGKGWIPTGAKRLEAQLAGGQFPSPARRTIPPRRPRRSRPVANGRERPATDGDYPLARTTFLMGPAMVIGLVSPHAGTASDVASTQIRSAPAALLDDIGPVVGFGGDTPVHIDAAEAFGGVSAMGIPDSGKSVLVSNLWAWNCLERVAPSGRPDRPGARNTLIAFENKGEGAATYQQWSDRVGDTATLVELGNPDTPAIDMLDIPGSATQRASFFIAAMTYAFGADQIQGRSFEALSATLTAAFACPPMVAATATSVIPGEVSPVGLAHILLGGMGDEVGVALAGDIGSHAEHMDPTDPTYDELAQAVRLLAPFYGEKVTPAQRRTITESARNKMLVLVLEKSWWSPGRRKLNWADILEGHQAVIFNSGVTQTGAITDERLANVISAMLAYSLREAIMRTCSGWKDAGRSVSIFSDELSLLAKTSAEVVDWLRNQGRSYGVRLVFATQSPEQLLPLVRSALRGFATVFWFQQSDPQVIDEALAQLTIGGGDWSKSDIGNLEKFHAILRATAGGRLQPPVPIRMGWWGDHPDEFAPDQGYPIGSGLPIPLDVGPGPVDVLRLAPAADPYQSSSEAFETW
jgi:hypothetical protein